MVVGWGKVGAVRRMGKYLNPLQFFELKLGRSCNMGFGVVMLQKHPPSIDQCWVACLENRVYPPQLFRVEGSGHGTAIGKELVVDDTLTVPPNAQHHLWLKPPPLGDWFSALARECPLTARVGVPQKDPLLIARNDPPEKPFVEWVGEKLSADNHTTLSLPGCQFVWNFSTTFFDSPSS